MRTALARLLVLLLVPVVLVAGAARPAAAIAYGPIAPWSTSWGAALVSGVQCSFNSQWTLDGPSGGLLGQGVRTSATCKFGDWTMGTSSDYDVQIDYHGTSVDDPGKPCGMSTGFRDEFDIKGSWSLNAEQGTHYADGTSDPPTLRCNVDEVCYQFVRDARFQSDDGKTSCTTAGPGGAGGIVGYPPTGEPAVTGCEYGTPTKPTTGAPYKARTGGYSRWSIDVTSTVTPRATYPSGAAPVARWAQYVIVKYPNGTTAAFRGAQLISNPAQSMVTPIGADFYPHVYTPLSAGSAPQQMMSVANVSPDVDYTEWLPPAPTGSVIGVGLVAWPYFNAASEGWLAYGSTTGNRAPPAGATIQQNAAQGILGVNDSSRCSYYWGQKISDDANAVTVRDTPGGPMGATPIGTPDPAADPDTPTGGEDEDCGFSVLDPSTWAGAGICALVGLVNGLIEAVKDVVGGIGAMLVMLGQLAGKIATALGDVLKELFIPSPESWDLGGMVDQLKTRPPFSLMTDLLDVAGTFTSGFSGSGGCTNLINFGGDLKVSCASVKNTPGFGLGYGLLSVAMWACTGIACFRMFTSNFGDQS